MTTERKICRHCETKVVCRPKGLCWSCYYLPGVRESYPSTSKFSPTNPNRITAWQHCDDCGEPFRPLRADDGSKFCTACQLPDPLRSERKSRLRFYAAMAAINQPLFYSEVG